MTAALSKSGKLPAKRKEHPFRRAVLRGLGVVLPPLLTIVILLWVWNTVQDYVLVPVENAARHALTWAIADIHSRPPAETDVHEPSEGSGPPTFSWKNRTYAQIRSGKWIPIAVLEEVSANPGDEMPTTAEAIYHRYLDITYLKRSRVVPVFLSIFVMILYLLGKFLAAGVGRFLWSSFEQLIGQLPIIRTVYGSVKQVTDFVFSDQEITYTRIVAVEYPRKGIWSLGFVTGESMLDIRSAANEPVLSVLMCTSPMPATGFTITVRKSETIDLNITADQAFQFIVSCGVVVPAAQQQTNVAAEVASAIAQQSGSDNKDNGSAGKDASLSLGHETQSTE